MFTLDAPVASCKVPYMESVEKVYKDQQRARKALSRAGGELDAALEEVAKAKQHLAGLVRAASAVGLTEVEITNLSGVSRPTVRGWLGKT